ncbi:MAG: STAS domain-containing protein [Alphaproteobacteria bacterium]|nr:STAS domain-containing protein [Alphaproteobacteria bacterium]
MEFTIQRDGDKAVCTIMGRIDTNTAPELLEKIDFTDLKELVFDLSDVDYVFSAGLRVFLQAQKVMNANGGTMKLINLQPSVKEIFDIVGFSGIMDIE